MNPPPKLPEGAVLLGKGGTFKRPEIQEFAGWCHDPADKDDNWDYEPDWSGSMKDWFYAAPADSEIARLNASPPERDLPMTVKLKCASCGNKSDVTGQAEPTCGHCGAVYGSIPKGVEPVTGEGIKNNCFVCHRCGYTGPAPHRCDDTPIRKRLDWPTGNFRVMDEPGEHDPCWLIDPNGHMHAFNQHAVNGVDQARASWIANALNALLDAPPPAGAKGEPVSDPYKLETPRTDEAERMFFGGHPSIIGLARLMERELAEAKREVEKYKQWETDASESCFRMESTIDQLRADLDSARTWRSMDSAPLKTKVLVWCPFWSDEPFVAVRTETGWWADVILHDGEEGNPLGWLPLPPTPSSEQETMREGKS